MAQLLRISIFIFVGVDLETVWGENTFRRYSNMCLKMDKSRLIITYNWITGKF